MSVLLLFSGTNTTGKSLSGVLGALRGFGEQRRFVLWWDGRRSVKQAAALASLLSEAYYPVIVGIHGWLHILVPLAPLRGRFFYVPE